ncbi:MAG: ISKra4 family transposase [Bdellovibrio sp.]|nr:MAG: ISKra4 family transposase [Bdellovibrio sp.]
MERTYKKLREKSITSIFGKVEMERMGYGSPGEESLFPKDAVLNLSEDSYSHGVRKLVALEASRGSFEDAIESVERATGVKVPKRQAQQLTEKAAMDFDGFYNDGSTSEQAKAAANALPILALSMDGKGIVMRREDLKEATREKAEQTSPKLKKRLSKGEKRNAKRMATVASVYSIDTFVRTPEQIAGEFSPAKPVEPVRRPKPAAKRVWASIEKEPEDVIKEIFKEALRRDPQLKRKWVCLVDGNRKQLIKLKSAAKRHKVAVTLVLDIIHVIEYLWKASRVFHEETSTEAEKWVSHRLLEILRGRASHIAAGMRRSATLQGVKKTDRKPVDICAGYLLRNKAYLHYDRYLKQGFPIATGVIEGACRHLIKDRMDVTGARWTLQGAEAVLKLRSLKSSGDFNAYWEYHEAQEFARNHGPRYAKPSILNKLRLNLPQ